MTRLVLVLGYSPHRRWRRLHPICAARVEHAAGLAAPEDVVVLSGTNAEVERMADAWGDRPGVVYADSATRTADTAVAVTRLVPETRATEVLVVTSWWHRPRAALMVRRAMREQPDVHVADAGAPSPRAWPQVVREGACFPLIPLHLALAGRRARRRRAS